MREYKRGDITVITPIEHGKINSHKTYASLYNGDSWHQRSNEHVKPTKKHLLSPLQQILQLAEEKGIKITSIVYGSKPI